MDLTLLPIVASSILLIIVLLGRYYRRHSCLPYPPGPKPLPLFGNIFDIPDIRKPWTTYAQWRELHGDLIHVYKPGHGHLLIINSSEVAFDLLEKRSKIYSDREYTLIEELGGFDFNIGVLPYSQRWRQSQKTFHQILRPSAAVYFNPIQHCKVLELLSNVLDTPADFMDHIATLASSLIFSGIYGLEGSSQDRPARLAKKVNDAFTQVFMPGTFTLPNIFPFMRYLPSWVPGCGFKKFTEESRKLVQEMKDLPFDMALERMNAGTSSLVGELVSKNQDDPNEILRIKDMAATIYSASFETMTSTISTFFLLMTLNPHVQTRAQEEVDSVIGLDRLPHLDDRKSLPYVEAVYREVMRWNPAAPLGIPHKTSERDIYNGYYIPKGTVVVANIWAMTHNESIYQDVNEFKPDRFLTGSPDAPFTSIESILAFGFGRRKCTGRYVADATVWLTVASVLATLNITKAKDQLGNDIEVPGHLSEIFFSRPEPFHCSITPGSTQAERLIRGN